MVFTRGPSRAINSPRHLVLRHAQRILDEHKRLEDPEAGGDPPPALKPGEEQLYSFYLPGLEAGSHKISVVQNVHTPAQGDQKAQDLPLLESEQNFNIVAPRFSLPDGSIHSSYPPQGHGDTVETLPHVVLNDPHLPWERVASEIDAPDKDRNRVPWLAVLVFTQEELRLGDTVLNGSTSIFTGTKDLTKPVTQSATLAINMKVSDIWLTQNSTTPIKTSTDSAVTEATTDVIFLQSQLFTSLVTNYDKDGNATPGQKNPDVSRYKYLAHVRNINTTGMADAGVEDDGLFSIIVSHRVGPLTITQPTPVVVHLVSIEGVEEMTLPISTSFVALSSLYSWTYTCLPPNSLNVYDAFHALGDTLSVLRAPDTVINELKNNKEPEAARIAQRLEDGYSLTRYRTQIGELTVALTRGPFTPTVVKHPLTSDWTSLSTFGTDLQILDQDTGLMDITYSSAWNLGKTLALADQAFAAALSRVRTYIHDKTMNNAKKTILNPLGAYKTREEHLESLADSVKSLNQLPKSNLLRGPNSMVNRWRKPDVATLDLSFTSPLINPIFDEHAAPVARILASSSGGGQIYDETNTPYSTDWMLIFKWVLDRMYLVNVPAHYLITDPTHLPRESLRFFHIDANWIDALIDGALSIANHLGRDDDKVRIAIKKAINDYISTVNPILKYSPPIPTYGFLLRSELCSQFPDLVVKAPLPKDDPRPPILRHENIDKGVMLCLFDRVPSDPEFKLLSFAQPPHQQSFAAAASLHVKEFTTSYKRVYTTPDPVDPLRKDPLGSQTWDPDHPDPNLPPVFLWGGNAEIRTLLFPAWAQDVFDYIKKEMNEKVKEGSFTDTIPSSALCGIQLNNPMWELQILLAKNKLGSLESITNAPRTLKLLDPRVKTVVVAPVVERVKAVVEKTPSASLPPSGERTRLMPLTDQTPPPHFRSLRAPVPRPFGDGSGGPANAPNIQYTVYPTNSTDNEVPTMTGLPLDLVFSIVMLDGWNDSFYLQEITLKVRIGPMTDERHNLIPNYRGPGATMLSNLRFNVLIEFTKDTMNLRVLPRSQTGVVLVAGAREMSFVLSLATINRYEKPVTVVTEVEEHYQGHNLTGKIFDINLVPKGGH